MLLVRTRLGPSTIHGIGLFLAEFVPKGTVVWRFTPGLDIEIPEETLLTMGEPAREEIEKYAYRLTKTGPYILLADNARFLNHSNEPNLAASSVAMDVAIRDINAGEELTVDYRTFDADWDSYGAWLS